MKVDEIRKMLAMTSRVFDDVSGLISSALLDGNQSVNINQHRDAELLQLEVVMHNAQSLSDYAEEIYNRINES